MSEPILRNVPLSEIDINPVALRDVNVEDEHFLALKDDIEKHGILQPALGYVYKNEAGEERVMLVNGLQRFTSCKQLGIPSLPMQLTEFKSELDTMIAQFATNKQGVPTKPFQFGNHMARILKEQPGWTASKLASELAVSLAFVAQRLKLTKLDENIGALVDEDKIPLLNAIALTKLAADEQLDYADRAQTMSPAQFAPIVEERCKAIRDAARENRQPAAEEFVPVAKMRKKPEILDELASPDALALLAKSAETVEQAVIMGVEWVMCLDPESVAVQRAKWEADKAAREAEKAKRAAEREEAKRQAAAAAAEDAADAASV